ncbi:LOW QUALITY PROTEIN: NF-kappa-B inhibitor delta [Megalops cyprinoides]|uniref:LOW QUALITY PROTEIN: NF-kappa-B inhibitor delta n=1 Tax=Megalops cyprinoides TaxID=118141 RepID=UPI001864E9C3|nr:LOW QUALITY PROTEIN: NF-kappa-B inhibitor delta [Megalops cyprinoides]
MHWPKQPKERSCNSLPTVKKLLEQKRKQETSSSPSSSSAAEASATATAVPVSTPAQATPTGKYRHCNKLTTLTYVISELGARVCPNTCKITNHVKATLKTTASRSPISPPGAAGSYSNTMGAVGPMPTFPRWEVSNPHPAPALQQDCPFSPVGSSYYLSPPEGFTQPYMPSSFTTQQTPDYSAAMSVLAYPDCPVTSAVTGTLQPPGCSWVPESSIQGHINPGHQGYGVQINTVILEEARMFLRGMDNSKKMWQDEDGDTILHIYTAKGLREYAFAAAENFQALGRLDSKEHKGKTALLVAVTANQPDIVQDLLSLGADINACDVKGQTALHLAATYGFPRVMETILTFGHSVDLEARNFEGQTPLHCAAISHSGTVKALFSAVPGQGDAGLQAQAEDKQACVQLLLQYGASLLSQDIKSNKTVLHLAVKEGNIHLVRYLLKLHLSDMQAFVNMKAHGNTALHMAAGLHGSGHQEEMIRLLLSRGADPSVRNLENDQPAHLLQSGERGEQLKLILKKRTASSRRRITSLQDQE